MNKKDFYQVSLKAIVKNNEGEVLILNGHLRGTFAGFYDLPGGRIDENEFNVPFEKIILRELKEEIGNVEVIINPKPVAIGRQFVPASMTSEKKDLHVLYILFEAKLVNGNIEISEEHEGFKWVKLEENDPTKLFKSGMLEGIKMYLNKQ